MKTQARLVSLKQIVSSNINHCITEKSNQLVVQYFRVMKCLASCSEFFCALKWIQTQSQAATYKYLYFNFSFRIKHSAQKPQSRIFYILYVYSLHIVVLHKNIFHSNVFYIEHTLSHSFFHPSPFYYSPCSKDPTPTTHSAQFTLFLFSPGIAVSYRHNLMVFLLMREPQVL